MVEGGVKGETHEAISSIRRLPMVAFHASHQPTKHPEAPSLKIQQQGYHHVDAVSLHSLSYSQAQDSHTTPTVTNRASVAVGVQ